MNDYFVYIVKCSDSSFYTGVTNNLERRVLEHNSGIYKGYTSSRLPVQLVFSERLSDIDQAIKLEKQIKGWSRNKKQALIDGDFELLINLSNKKNN
jgi:putative endonuclease